MTGPLPAPLGLSLAPAAPQDPPCPPLAAEVWLHHVGQPPTLETLRGRPVLLAELRKSIVHELIDLQAEYERRGLVVLAVTTRAYRDALVDQDALYAAPFPIGFGCETELELE